ncbi:hypothetical protein [Streptomyces sp. SAI-129]
MTDDIEAAALRFAEEFCLFGTADETARRSLGAADPVTKAIHR